MSLQSVAQDMGYLEVEEPMVLDPQESGEHVVVYPEGEPPSPNVVMEMHEPEAFPMEVEAPAHEDLMVEEMPKLPDLPGVDKLDPEMEQRLEVHEDPAEADRAKADEEAKKSKVPPKWDWQSKGAHGFIAWVKERCAEVPRHSGYDTAGVERAISYLEKLDAEISKAMRLDLDGELDANKIEEVRAQIDNGIARSHDRLDKLRSKGKKKKKAEFTEEGLVKEAQKAAGVSGIVVTVPLDISGIVRTCINGTVSAGHDLEDMFNRLSKRFKLTDRERFACMQLFADMGYPMRRDRGFDTDEDVDPTSSDNFDWAANYQA